MKGIKWHKSYYLFGLLFFYVLAQFIWWATLLQRQSLELLYLKNPFVSQANIRDTQSMIIGEGAVFLIIFLLLIIFAFRSINAELKLAQRQKNFLLSVSHELKTPLATGRSIIQTMLRRSLPKEKELELLETLLGENKRLSDLVNNVFIAQLLSNGKFSLQRQEGNFSEFLLEKCNHWKNNYAPDLVFEHNIEENIQLNFDPQSMETVLVNLFSNAQKYAKAGTKLSLALFKKGNKTTVEVTDQGIGIPEKEQKAIFDLFYRLGNEETRKTKGTGLGLYICKNIIEEHGGEISVSNNGNQGSRFTIIFN